MMETNDCNIHRVADRRYRRDRQRTRVFPRVHGRRRAVTSRARDRASLFGRQPLLDHRGTIQIPDRLWEILQLGNCGSPIETDEGWLVLTHGVGAMRTYSLGAILLDLDEPQRVLARSIMPILSPNKDRPGGYVPNVVYSCGGFAHNDILVLPYGVVTSPSRRPRCRSQLLSTLQPEDLIRFGGGHTRRRVATQETQGCGEDQGHAPTRAHRSARPTRASNSMIAAITTIHPTWRSPSAK